MELKERVTNIPEKSRLEYCYVQSRDGAGPLFGERDDGTVFFNLIGYAIMPLEEYSLGQTKRNVRTMAEDFRRRDSDTHR